MNVSLQPSILGLSDPVRMFVSSNRVAERFDNLDLAIQVFMNECSDALEKVYAGIVEFSDIPIGQIDSSKYKEGFVRDTANAEKGLHAYNRLYGRIDLQLALAASNFLLPKFLEEQHISADQLGFIQSEIREYYEETYGLLSAKYWELRQIGEKLADILQWQVDKMKEMPGVNYFQGFSESMALQKKFMIERDMFYNQFVVRYYKDDGVLNTLRTRYEAKKLALYKGYKAFVQLKQQDLDADLGRQKTLVQKSLVVSLYFLGVLRKAIELKEKAQISAAVKYVTDKAVTYAELKLQQGVLKRNKEALDIEANGIGQAAKGLVTDNVGKIALNGLTALTNSLKFS